MSELKAILATPHPKMKNACDGAIEVYPKSDVDAAIAELKQKLQDQCISCPVKMQEDDVIAEKDNEIRRLKRALYKACANWAHHRVFVRLYTNEKAWENVESKCRAKAEEYK